MIVLASFLPALVPAQTAGSGDAPEDWLRLDREIALLAQKPDSQPEESRIGGFIRTRYEIADDPSGGDDVSGVVLGPVWLEFNGNVAEDVRYLLGFGFREEDGEPVLGVRDARVSFPLTESVRSTVGQFRVPFLYSATSARSKGLFLERSSQGAIWNRRDQGWMLDGRVGRLRWFASAFNGGDGAREEFLLAGKLAWALLGPGIDLKQEGGYGVDSPTRVTTAVGVVDEGTIEGGTVLAAELEGASGRFFFHGEIVDYGEGFVPKAVRQGAAKNASGRADTTPYGATLACMLSERCEVAARYEGLDDANDSHKTWLGLNWYVRGHKCKWQLDWIRTEGADEGDVLQLGLTVGF